MSRKLYAVGDTVILKANLHAGLNGDRTCEIVGMLPADHGEAQYRVRLGDEKNERRIVASDIDDADTSASPNRPGFANSGSTGTPWLTVSSIRVRR